MKCYHKVQTLPVFSFFRSGARETIKADIFVTNGNGILDEKGIKIH